MDFITWCFSKTNISIVSLREMRAGAEEIFSTARKVVIIITFAHHVMK